MLYHFPQVLPHPSSVLFSEDLAIVSPGVVCEPSGTTFEKPLQLVIPHCAVLTDPSKASVTMHFIHGDKKGELNTLSSLLSSVKTIKTHCVETMLTQFDNVVNTIWTCGVEVGQQNVILWITRRERGRERARKRERGQNQLDHSLQTQSLKIVILHYGDITSTIVMRVETKFANNNYTVWIPWKRGRDYDVTVRIQSI